MSKKSKRPKSFKNLVIGNKYLIASKDDHFVYIGNLEAIKEDRLILIHCSCIRGEDIKEFLKTGMCQSFVSIPKSIRVPHEISAILTVHIINF
jgi:hypothetical protein